MRGLATRFATSTLLALAACTGSVQPAELAPEAMLQTPEPILVVGSARTAETNALVGHLAGVGAPLGSEVQRGTYSATRTEVVLSGVTCGARIRAAYTPAPALPGFGQTCADGALTLSATVEEPERAKDDPVVYPPSWNPWNEDHWHVGPFKVLPRVETGLTFSSHVLWFEGSRAEARLSPKQPNRFVDLIGAGLADAGWAARPVPGGTVYTRAGWNAQVEQDGALVSVKLEGPRGSSGL